jgi:pilus assembly protein CpaC
MMMRNLSIIAAVGLALLVSATGYAADPGSPPADPDASAQGPTIVRSPPPDTGPIGHAVQVRATGRPILLEVGRGTLVRLPGPANTVFVADPLTADVTIKTPSLIYITAVAPGSTTLYAVDASDHVLLNTVIRVELDLTRLRQGFHALGVGDSVKIDSVGGCLVLSGIVSTASQAQKAVALATAIADETLKAKPCTFGDTGTLGGTAAGAGAGAGTAGATHIINHLAVATPNQINLRVRIAQVKVDILKQLGISLSKGAGRFTFSTIPTLIAAPGAAAAALALGQPGSTDRIDTFLDALATEGLATDLAEPNLTAMSGEKASFLVGGEIFITGSSVPTGASSAAGGAPSTVGSGTMPVTFGVRLDFTATIIDANHINLKLRPEVSALDYANATQISGSTTPGKTETVAETTVELGSGETFALAGLLRHDTSDTVSKVPGLGDIPLVGALFRSNKFTHTDTELVIVVTPYIVKPMAMAAATPVDGFVAPHDASRLLMGANYRQQLPAPPRGPMPADGKGLIGPVGFRLD